MKTPKKRKWTYYLMLFSIFTVVDFLVNMLIDKHDLRYAVIDALVGGVFFTVLWCLFDRPKKEDGK